MERFGSELIFISIISGDGEKIELIENEEATKFCQKELYKLNSLSISRGTYIASGMSSYVVKLKNPPR
jgi:hypothetical protein